MVFNRIREASFSSRCLSLSHHLVGIGNKECVDAFISGGQTQAPYVEHMEYNTYKISC